MHKSLWSAKIKELKRTKNGIRGRVNYHFPLIPKEKFSTLKTPNFCPMFGGKLIIMKVTCSNCEAVYNIDISKIPVIPEGGITTNCPKCKGKIPIKIEDKSQKEERRDQIIPCPECGHVNISTDTCVQCGKIFSKEEIAKLMIPNHQLQNIVN